MGISAFLENDSAMSQHVVVAVAVERRRFSSDINKSAAGFSDEITIPRLFVFIFRRRECFGKMAKDEES